MNPLPEFLVGKASRVLRPGATDPHDEDGMAVAIRDLGGETQVLFAAAAGRPLIWVGVDRFTVHPDAVLRPEDVGPEPGEVEEMAPPLPTSLPFRTRG